MTDHSRSQIHALMQLGAVYLDKQRVLADQPLTEGQTVRLHNEPKRYPAALRNWTERILHKGPDFLVVKKPIGVPVHPTLDNQIENALYQTSLILKEKLFPVHRLDINTSGLCVFGRQVNFQKIFHQVLKSDDTEKIYLALCQKPPRLGLHSHYMEKQKAPPHLIFDKPSELRKLCRLEVLGVSEFKGHALTRIKLLTGRTHQIRAQMAHLNSPLTGDLLYAPRSQGSFLLHSAELRFTYNDKRYDFIEEPEWLKDESEQLS